MSEALAKSMTKAHELWQEGKYKESAEVLQSTSPADKPQVALAA